MKSVVMKSVFGEKQVLELTDIRVTSGKKRISEGNDISEMQYSHTFNLFSTSKLVHPYHLDELVYGFRGFCWMFSFLFDINIPESKQY